VSQPEKASRVIIPRGHVRGERQTPLQRAWYRVLWVVVQVVARGYFRTRVRGLENVPRHGAFIVSPIHRSNLDTPLIGVITRRRLRYMGKESLWKSRFGAWFFTMAGGFPVERGHADRAALRACLEVLEAGEPLVLFPEGTRQFGPHIAELFDGPAWLAARAQVPVLPVGLGGSERAMGKGAKLPRPTRMSVVVGPPLAPPTPREGSDRPSRKAVRAFTEELSEAIQEQFATAQELAGDRDPRRAPRRSD
jgi:1-acyl-sn-glycerol-3-phosphate acyltransferase